MNNELQIFNHPEFGDVRVIGDSDNPRFCLSDVCKMLGLDASQVMKRLDVGVVSIHPIIDRLGRTQSATFVNENGLYDVILDSRNPEAERFRKWITAEVVPSIRKHGVYATAEELKAKQDETALLKVQLAEAKPKVDYCDVIRLYHLFKRNEILPLIEQVD